MKRTLLILLAVALCLFPLSGCVDRDIKNSNCQIVNDDLGADHFQEAFLKENRTEGADYDDAVLEDDALPKSRAIIIQTREMFDAVFAKDAEGFAVDFASEMLVLYTFTSEYRREIELVSMSVEDQTVTFHYEMKDPSLFFAVGDAVRPFQRFVLVKMDRLEVDSAVFTDQPD